MLKFSQIKEGTQVKNGLQSLSKSYDASKVFTTVKKEDGTNYNAEELLSELKGSKQSLTLLQWEPNKEYSERDVVLNGNMLYRCVAAHTSGQLFDDNENAQWQVVSVNPTDKHIKQWSAGTVYRQNDIVLHNGELYQNRKENSDNLFVRDNWTLLSAKIAPYTSGMEYSTNDIVVYDNAFYQAKESLTAADFDATKWQKLGDTDTQIADIKENLDQEIQQVKSQVSAIPKFKIEVVSELPTENQSDTTVYLLHTAEQQENKLYDEYIYVNGAWEKLGSATVDLSSYLTKDQADLTYAKFTALNAYVKKTDADTTYLKIADAKETYLSQTDAANIYQKKTDVEVTNESLKTDLAPYLQKTDADTTYAKIASLADFIEKSTAENTYAKKTDLDNVSGVAAYKEGDSHKKGEVVAYNGNLYEALTDTTEAPSNAEAYQQIGKDYVDTSVNDLKTQFAALEDTVHRLPEFSISVVDALPESDISDTTVYLVKNTAGKDNNLFDEYIHVNNTWELLGTADTDMSAYLTKDDAGNTYVTNDSFTATLTEKLSSYLEQTAAEETYLKKTEGLGPDAILTADQSQNGAAASDKTVYSSFAADSMFAKKTDLTTVSGLLVDSWNPSSQVLTLSLNIGNENKA